jgi:hypothetical protein
VRTLKLAARIRQVTSDKIDDLVRELEGQSKETNRS